MQKPTLGLLNNRTEIIIPFRVTAKQKTKYNSHLLFIKIDDK